VLACDVSYERDMASASPSGSQPWRRAARVC